MVKDMTSGTAPDVDGCPRLGGGNFSRDPGETSALAMFTSRLIVNTSTTYQTCASTKKKGRRHSSAL